MARGSDWLDKPIFFIGMPRSGTSIIQEAFCRHEALGWLSNYTAHFPSMPRLTAVHSLFGSLQGQRSQGQRLVFYNKLLPRPSESYPVWERIFGRKFLYTCLEGVIPTVNETDLARSYIAMLLAAQGRARFCAKLTGPPRVSFLSRVFEGATFIDIIRDPRAVVASLKVDRDRFWKSKGGEESPFWNCEYGRPEYGLWIESGQMPAVLASLQWVHMHELTKKEVAACNARYLRVRYEDYVESPHKILREVMSYCGLQVSERVLSWVGDVVYSSANSKFVEVLDEVEIEWIERMARRQLDELGYARASRRVCK